MSLITWNSDDKHSSIMLSNDDLTASYSASSGYFLVRATKGKSNGKWYWENKIDSLGQISTSGICTETTPYSNGASLSSTPNTLRIYHSGGYVHSPLSSGHTSYAMGDTIGIALDIDEKSISFYKNGVFVIKLTTLYTLSNTLYPCLMNYNGSITTTNFGATPFQYPVPEGYLPYDIENADWFHPKKYLLKQNNKILTIESSILIETELQEPLTRLDFEELGFDNIELLLDEDLNNSVLLINTEKITGPTIKIKSIPYNQLILPIEDIYLRMLSNIHSFTVTSTRDMNGVIRLVFSIDEGVNWLTYNAATGEFEEIDISNLEEVKNNGITPDAFNSIRTKWNDIITDRRIRFGYYLGIDDTNDIAEVDKLEIIMDVLGSWDALIHELDYDYEYDNEKIYIELYRDGSYKINYI